MLNSRRRIQLWSLWLVLVCGILSVWTWLFRGLLYDDAYISFRFSENWASGIGLTWNAGAQVVEGFTSFLWVAIGTAIELLAKIPPHKSMVFVGIASWLAMVVIVVPLISKLLTTDRKGLGFRVARAVCILTVLMTPQVALGAFQGLETAFYSCILALVVFVAIKVDAPWLKGLLAICSFVAFMTRPDALAFVLPLWAVLFVFSNGSGKRACLRAFGVFILVLLLYSVVKWQWSGYPFPNTFYIKKGFRLQGLGYVGRYLGALTPVWLFMAYSIGRLGATKLMRDRSFMLLIVPTLFFCISYTMMRPMMGWAFRFLIPTWPLFVLAALRVEVLRQNTGRSSITPAAVLRGSAVFYLTLTGLTMNSWLLMKGDYQYISSLCRFTNRANVTGGMLLSSAAELSPAPVIATGDIGALSYFSKLKTIDLIGLVDSTIAHQGLTHEYFLQNRPDIVVLQDLFLRSSPPTSPAINIELTVDGARCWLDVERYRSILTDPFQFHTGAGSTYQVVTSPRFANLYVNVGRLPYGEGYPLFLRKDYERFKELLSILSKIIEKSK